MRIVEALLQNSRQKPILIICYTNHALDQFLEGIAHFCKEGELIRIGARSQSEVMNNYCLVNIKKKNYLAYLREAQHESSRLMGFIYERIQRNEKKIEVTHRAVVGCDLGEVIKRCNRDHYDQLESYAAGRRFDESILNWLGFEVKTPQMEQEEQAAANSNRGNGPAMPPGLRDMMELDEEEVNAIEGARMIDEFREEEFCRDKQMQDVTRAMNDRQPNKMNFENITPIDFKDDDGFTLVQVERPSTKKQISLEIEKGGQMSLDDAAAVDDINRLSQKDRWKLYRLWIELYVRDLQDKIVKLHEEYSNEYLRYNAKRNEEDIKIAKRVKIIGMTTTGAAKCRHIIDAIKPKITGSYYFFVLFLTYV